MRYREYLGSGLCFLEVKRKTGRGRTTRCGCRWTPSRACRKTMPPTCVRPPATTPLLHPTLWNQFHPPDARARRPARTLTLDLGLRFHAPIPAGDAVELGGLVVAEVKQARLTAPPLRARHAAHGTPPGRHEQVLRACSAPHPGLVQQLQARAPGPGAHPQRRLTMIASP